MNKYKLKEYIKILEDNNLISELIAENYGV